MVSRQDLACLENINTYVVFLRWFGASLGYSWLAWKTWTPESVFAIGLGRFLGISLVFCSFESCAVAVAFGLSENVDTQFFSAGLVQVFGGLGLPEKFVHSCALFQLDSWQILGASGKFGH